MGKKFKLWGRCSGCASLTLFVTGWSWLLPRVAAALGGSVTALCGMGTAQGDGGTMSWTWDSDVRAHSRARGQRWGKRLEMGAWSPLSRRCTPAARPAPGQTPLRPAGEAPLSRGGKPAGLSPERGTLAKSHLAPEASVRLQEGAGGACPACAPRRGTGLGARSRPSACSPRNELMSGN